MEVSFQVVFLYIWETRIQGEMKILCQFLTYFLLPYEYKEISFSPNHIVLFHTDPCPTHWSAS
jgi:hypothetical protein